MTQSNRHYDHTAWLARKRQTSSTSYWEPLEDNPIAPISRAAIQPLESAQDVISLSGKGKQTDDAVTVAQGTHLRALPVIGLSLPLSIGICALAWLSGIVTAGFLSYIVTVLVVWGAISLACYTRIARQDHVHSHYGVERLKVQSLTALKQQEMASDYALKRAALDAYIRRLEEANGE